MLKTPAAFNPLLTPRDDVDPLTFLFHGGRVLLRLSDLALPEKEAMVAFEQHRVHPLGEWNGRYCQVAWTDSEAVPHPDYGWHGLRALFGVLDDEFVGLAGRACQLAEWARTHRYCGACATPMELGKGDRSFKCAACGHTAYPRISPAMMVLIRKGDAVLLAMHTQSPYKRHTALAGFLEAGESVEEAIHREVHEEVGLRVHNIRYFGSQSWPFPHSLMLAFTADYLDGEIRVDQAEIAEARWFGPDDEWPERPVSVSIAAELVNAHRPPGK
ncbi:NAD(+) diphosphatase [Pseudoduganella namucuonensis]|uniref:NAD(+) diphosphatase n=1 Tax=Pseudoduganella namucuonensis TaxID=1035707 RepID=A0A1I7LV70_9BURK|nr:NAD(+) diphosphatase [Pseudoduganella namucuonensis]SFV13549.1 NAD+ diphosphatase [Pseudoduganella namucuonensis]